MKIRGSSWKFALIFLAGVLIAIQLLLLVQWRWHFLRSQRWHEKLPPDWVSFEQSDEPSGSGDHGLLPVNSGNSTLLTGRPAQIVQELVCQRNQQSRLGCLAIVDGPNQAGSGFARSLVAEPNRGRGPLAQAELQFPLHYNFTREESRQWPVLTERLPLDYQRLMAAQPFITQTFAPGLTPAKIPEGRKRRILCLGLHGSGLNGFFASLSTKYDVTVVEPEPAMRYIATKWFGLEEEEHHRVFLENPAFYVTARARLIDSPNTTKVPHRFHFIAVDLCHMLEGKEPVTGHCPTGEFGEESVVSALDRNLAENGTIAIRFFSPSNGGDPTEQHRMAANMEHQRLQLYSKFFRNCYFVGLGPDLVLTCTRKGPLTRAAFYVGFRKVPREWQLFANGQQPKFFLDLEAL